MAMTINTNVASLNAQRNLGRSQGMLNQSLERLSTGLRINSAKDDAGSYRANFRFSPDLNRFFLIIKELYKSMYFHEKVNSISKSRHIDRSREMS